MASSKYRKQYYEDNKEVIAAGAKRYRSRVRLNRPDLTLRNKKRTKEYHKTFNGRAALKASSINAAAKKRNQMGKLSKVDIIRLWESPYCAHCDSACELQVDHVIPSMDGGLNTFDNIQFLCPDCHFIKTRVDKNRRSMLSAAQNL